MKEVEKATRQVLSRSTKKMPQGQEEGHKQNQKKSVFSKKQILAAVARVQNKELNTKQRRQALNIYMIMKNSNLCSSNPTCRIGRVDRSTFHGDDLDYAYPYSHRYNEPDSDRGATDE
jgi:hypothetical protein